MNVNVDHHIKDILFITIYNYLSKGISLNLILVGIELNIFKCWSVLVPQMEQILEKSMTNVLSPALSLAVDKWAKLLKFTSSC